jgi:hypothetical protein
VTSDVGSAQQIAAAAVEAGHNSKKWQDGVDDNPVKKEGSPALCDELYSRSAACVRK